MVTAPFLARTWPVTFAPAPRVMLASATMFPARAVVAPRVAELPTCQKTPQLSPPLVVTTDELLAVVSELPTWKTNSELLFPWKLSVSVPVRRADEEKQ